MRIACLNRGERKWTWAVLRHRYYQVTAEIKTEFRYGTKTITWNSLFRRANCFQITSKFCIVCILLSRTDLERFKWWTRWLPPAKGECSQWRRAPASCMTTLFYELHLAEEHNSVSGKKFRIWQLKQNIVVQREGLASLLCTWETHVQISSLEPDIFTAVWKNRTPNKTTRPST